jgi:LysR family transcriptional regulator, carnitine catabolism transcriptional activator
MDVRQLSYVLAVVDQGSFTKAAAELQIAQPSLSQAIRGLEAELGIELFVRRARPVRLTEAGQALVEPARRAVRDLGTARAAVDAVRGLSGGHLDLVSLPTLSIDPVAGIVGRFRQAHPDVVVRLLEPEDAADVANLVRAGACELGICDLPLPDPAGLLAHRLATQGYQVVLPPGPRPRPAPPRPGSQPPPNRVEPRMALAELAELALVTTPPGTSTRRVVDDALAGIGRTTRVAVETDHRESLIPLVLAGAGVAVVPDSLVASARGQGAVVMALDRPLTRDIGMIHRDGPLSPAARAFFDLAQPSARAEPVVGKGSRKR